VSDTTYALYPVFTAAPELRELLAGAEDRARAAGEIEALYEKWAGTVEVRGTYSTVGLRADADVLLWLVGDSVESVQQAFVEFRRTDVGELLEPSWSFLGVVKPAEFTPDHQPAFVRGDPPGRYLCVYPFVRTAEWYLLPSEERAALLREHGGAGREFPDILANTTSAFGLGDWEWILAFESERLDAIVDCIRRLRGTEARRYTKEEVPFVTGIRKDVASVLEDLC
jgi:hydrogen peroxide-dependent heme synthase